MGLLFLPSTIVKLSDLDRPLPSLAPLAEPPTSGKGDGLPFARDCASDGVVLLPSGVANRSWGGAGRDELGRGTVFRDGTSGMLAPLFDTAFWLGDGGMARPRRGARAPLLFPGMGGRKSGAGDGEEPSVNGAPSWPVFILVFVAKMRFWQLPTRLWYLILKRFFLR